MKIDRVELYHVSVPLPQPFYPAWIPGYPQTANRFTLLRLTTDDGVSGLAAGVAFERERQGLGGLIGPYLIGLDPSDTALARQRLREAGYLGWRNFWMEAAFWDIRGQLEGRPVWALLGGSGAGRVRVYASCGEVRPPARRAREVAALREMGFRAVKVRVQGTTVSEDLAQVEAVRAAVGDSMEIAVDANQGWRVTLAGQAPKWTLQRATEFAHGCAALGVSWIEEPLDMHAYDDLAELCRRSQVPIAGGELNGGWHEFTVMLEKGSYDVYQPDATMGGGVGDARRVLEACAERGLGFSPHTWTNGLGFLVNLHVHASGARNQPLEYPYEPPGWTPEARDGILAEPVKVGADGMVAVPQGAGLGIVIDPDKLARFGEKYFDMSARGLAVKTVREKGLLTALRLRFKRKR